MKADGWSLDDKRQPLLPEEKLGVTPAQALTEAEHAKNNLPDVLTRWLRLRSAQGLDFRSGQGLDFRSGQELDFRSGQELDCENQVVRSLSGVETDELTRPPHRTKLLRD
jgi:hypothetical protein